MVLQQPHFSIVLNVCLFFFYFKNFLKNSCVLGRYVKRIKVGIFLIRGYFIEVLTASICPGWHFTKSILCIVHKSFDIGPTSDVGPQKPISEKQIGTAQNASTSLAHAYIF